MLGLSQVVGGHDDGGVVVDPGQNEIVQARLGDRVQSGRRLVQDEELGCGHEGGREVNGASLPAGEPRQPGVGLLAEPDGVEHLVDAAHPPRRRQLDRADPLQLVPHSPLGVVGPALLHQPDPRPEVGARPTRIGVEHAHPAAGRGQRAQQVLHEGRLAHAVGAEQADDLSGLDRQIDATQHRGVPVGELEVLRGDDWSHRTNPPE